MYYKESQIRNIQGQQELIRNQILETIYYIINFQFYGDTFIASMNATQLLPILGNLLGLFN